MPWMIVEDKANNSYCVHKQNEDKTAGEKMKCYGSEDEAKKYMAAMYANSDHANMSQDFIFVELQAKADELRMIDGMAAGTFTAKSGQEVTFHPEDLQNFVNNTQAIIESTKTDRGEIVGLPIDRNGHDHLGGAGWIVGVELDKARNVIRFAVRWTKAGIDLIKGNIRRFFSPSVDPVEQYIEGGSLTNTPATRDNKGKFLLRPVELSQSIKEIDMEKTVEQLTAENEALAAKAAEDAVKIAELTTKVNGTSDSNDEKEVAELNTFLEDKGEGVEELSKRAQERAELIIRAERRKDKVVEFATMIVGGTKAKPFGFPIRTSRIVKLLLSLSEKQAQEVQELIGAVYQKAVDFAEHGIDGSNYSMKPRLPQEFTESAKIWFDSGKPIKEWFTQMGDDAPGKYEDFNVAEFEKAEE